MKHLKSSFHDLHRIFEQGITVRDIAEPLASFDHECSCESAREFMDSKGFDVIGVRKDGEVRGYALKEDLGAASIGANVREMGDEVVLPESAPMLRALESLSDRRWMLVRSFGNPGGIVTRGDLQKAPMRMWLFGLISLLEMQMLRSIREIAPEDDWWSTHLSLGRLEAAKRIFKLRRQKNEEISLSDCLQIADKATIFKKEDSLFQSTGCHTKRDWNDLMKNVENLRNNLAHSNALEADSWPEIAKLATSVERTLKHLEARS